MINNTDMNIDERAFKRKQIASLIEKVGLRTVIDNFQNVLDAIWSNVFSTPKLDSYLKKRLRTCPGIIASINTLQGIDELCEIEDYPDAFLLIRKLRDNLFLDLFLFEAQKTFERIPSDSFGHIDLNNEDEVMKMLDSYYMLCVNAEMTNDELKAINKWKNNELLMSNDKYKREFFQFDKYKSYLKNHNEDFNECNNKFLDEHFSKMNNKLNDYAHSNSESVMICRQKPANVLNDIKETLVNLEHLFLISLFFVDSTLLESDDYGDYIESNMTPPEGSQYWVNGYILDAFMDIKCINIDLFDYLIKHNEYSMKIDIE